MASKRSWREIEKAANAGKPITEEEAFRYLAAIQIKHHSGFVESKFGTGLPLKVRKERQNETN
jgi:hypothetical protein